MSGAAHRAYTLWLFCAQEKKPARAGWTREEGCIPTIYCVCVIVTVEI